jgi:hypothetical protein
MTKRNILIGIASIIVAVVVLAVIGQALIN